MKLHRNRGFFALGKARIRVLAGFLLLAISAGCASAVGQPDSAYPAPTAFVESYPAPGTGATAGAGQTASADNAYPAPGGSDLGPGPLAMPAVENLSRISARLIEVTAGETQTDTLRLKVELLSSEPVNGMPDFTAGRVGEQIEIVVSEQGLPGLAPGDTLQAEVSYRGDERGGMFYLKQFVTAVP